MVEITLEALIGLTMAGTTLILGIMHRWKGDICKDIQAVKADIKIEANDLREYFKLREKIVSELDQRLSRIEGRTIERDSNNPTYRDSLAHNHKEKNKQDEQPAGD